MTYNPRYFNTGQVTTPQITESAVTEDKLANDAVTSPKIKNATIKTEDIADKAVTLAKLGDDVPAVGIPDNSIPAAKLADNAVERRHISAAAVDSSQLAVASVTTDKIRDANVTGVKIAANAITTGKIATGAVGTNDIAASAVDSSKLAVDSVITEKIANQAVTGFKIQDASITPEKLSPTVQLGDRMTFLTPSLVVLYLTAQTNPISETEIDLSAIVPAGAKAVIARAQIYTESAAPGNTQFIMHLRKPPPVASLALVGGGIGGEPSVRVGQFTASGREAENDGLCPVDANRRITYQVETGPGTGNTTATFIVVITAYVM